MQAIEADIEARIAELLPKLREHAAKEEPGFPAPQSEALELVFAAWSLSDENDSFDSLAGESELIELADAMFNTFLGHAYRLLRWNHNPDDTKAARSLLIETAKLYDKFPV